MDVQQAGEKNNRKPTPRLRPSRPLSSLEASSPSATKGPTYSIHQQKAVGANLPKRPEVGPSKAIDQLHKKLQTILSSHPYPELRSLQVKIDGQQLLVIGRLRSYYLKQILVSSTRTVRTHIAVEHDVEIE